jgi:hypothetical protein
MKKLLLGAAALAALITTPALASPDPFASPAAFNEFYRGLVTEGAVYGIRVQPSLCDDRFCANHMHYLWGGWDVLLSNVYWHNGVNDQSICISKPREGTQLCGRNNDGQVWTETKAGTVLRVIRQSW